LRYGYRGLPIPNRVVKLVKSSMSPVFVSLV
jgi:hypothetical protein